MYNHHINQLLKQGAYIIEGEETYLLITGSSTDEVSLKQMQRIHDLNWINYDTDKKRWIYSNRDEISKEKIRKSLDHRIRYSKFAIYLKKLSDEEMLLFLSCVTHSERLRKAISAYGRNKSLHDIQLKSIEYEIKRRNLNQEATQ